MSQHLCLSRNEIRELCRTPIKARQVAFFVRNGIRHYLDAHGWPVVLRSAVEGEGKKSEMPPVWRSNKAL